MRHKHFSQTGFSSKVIHSRFTQITKMSALNLRMAVKCGENQTICCYWKFENTPAVVGPRLLTQVRHAPAARFDYITVPVSQTTTTTSTTPKKCHIPESFFKNQLNFEKSKKQNTLSRLSTCLSVIFKSWEIKTRTSLLSYFRVWKVPENVYLCL